MAEQGQNPGQDSGLGPLWVTIAIIIGFALIWYYAHTQIVSFVLKVKLVEAYAIGLFSATAEAQIQLIKGLNPGDVSFALLGKICNDVGAYLAYPSAVVLVVLAVVIYLNSAPLRFRRTYSMHDLLETEHVNWPQITPVLKLNLVEQDLMKGPWAMALAPMEFAKRYQLLKENPLDTTLKGSLKNRARITVTVLRGEATRVFAMQLGAYWRGPEALPIYVRALFAMFAARANHDVAAAEKLVKRIAASTVNEELDFSGTDELLNQYKHTKVVTSLAEKHGFVLTVMATMLQLSRADGVFATADFLWLKPMDRTLWFLLNSVGRQTAFCEVAGVLAHWRAEIEITHRLYVPMVHEAVTGLELAITDILYEPDEKNVADSSAKEMAA